MKEYKCHAAQNGFYAGPVYVIRDSASGTEKVSADPAEEISRLDSAAEKIKQSMDSSRYSAGNAEVMETVRMMLDDQSFLNEIKAYIAENKCNAEYAVKCRSDEYARKMESSESEYLRARASDITGVGTQLIRVLNGDKESDLCSLTALAAPDISPAQLASFNQNMIGGIITDKGSPNSHLSILAGNLEIPYIYGNTEAVAAAVNSSYIIIDGGKLITEPDEKTLSEAESKMFRQTGAKKQRKASDHNITCRTRIYANISGPEDIPQLLESGADGVGLFRSEFLFLGKTEEPSEEEQYRTYRSVLEAMGDKEVIIRTMDIGSDKRVPWLAIPEEPNPALGLRGARVSLEKKEVFRTQIRALLRAGTIGNLKIMFPMIASEWEIDEIKDFIDSAAAELAKEGTAYRIPELGIMIETPAAALTADALSGKVKFFSIGTNDLTQYVLALDRESRGLDRYFLPHHEAVLRLIENTVREGHRNGVTTGICGQLAADPDMTERLVAAGVDELSVPISKVGQTRANAARAESVLAAGQASSGSEPAAEKKNDKAEAACADVRLAAPADGELVSMPEIPDPVFSSGRLGKCVGIIPENGDIYSPCEGTVISIAETKHAVTIRSDNGEELLIHVGIDTVKLGSRGFEVLVTEGERIKRTQKIMKADLDIITSAGFSTMVILVKL